MSSSSSSNNPSAAHPLFSTLLSFSALILLYFPPLLWTFLFSPAFLLAGFLLLSLLRLGATQRRFNHHNNQCQTQDSISNHHDAPTKQSETITAVVPEEDRGLNDAVTERSEVSSGGDVSCACFEESFVQWNVRAPLEVIYEEYEGDDDDHDNDVYTDPAPKQVRIGIERYPSLSLYYPETDSDSSSEEDEFPADGAWDSIDDNVCCFMWDEDEEKDELIEIALDNKKNKKASEDRFQLEEENLIEIDISPTRNHEFPDVN